MNCGTALELRCPNCATVNPAQARFCFHCGHQLDTDSGKGSPVDKPESDSLPDRDSLHKYISKDLLARLQSARATGRMQGERRVVTILFCDVVGSTAAAGQLDPEDWTEIMNGAFEYLIAPVYEYEGTLARLMGDAILAFFGAPIAHEDDPERAVLAALEILRGIQGYQAEVERKYDLTLEVRVGINTGKVVIGEVGSDLRLEYTAMGDAVNLAARMEHTAEPGTIQISSGTYKLVAPLFEAESLGKQDIKGKSEPVETYRVLGRKTEPGRLRGIEGTASPLIGRDAELAALQQAFEELRQGKGQIVSVIGEAGLGKSRLIAELRRSIASEKPGEPAGFHWFEGRALSYKTAVPFEIFRDLFLDLLDIPSEWSHAEQLTALTERTAVLLPENAAEVSPFLAAMLGIRAPNAGVDAVSGLEPQHLQDAIFSAVQKTVVELASEKPAVVVLDDLHWVDATSLRLLERLLPVVDRTSLMVLAMFRPRRDEPSWTFHELAQKDFPHRYSSINLRPLDPELSSDLVANLLVAPAFPEQVGRVIMEKAEGNPFFIEEVIRAMLDGKLLTRQENGWTTTPEFTEIGVPDSLAAVLTTRLDQLDAEAKRVLQAAAVVGREFRYDTLAGVSENGRSIEPSVIELIRREQIREASRMSYRSYAFRHGLIQETAYAALLRKDRRVLHQRVAEWWEQEEVDRVDTIARHFLAANLSERALPYLVMAGEQAARGYSVEEAFVFYSQAADVIHLTKDVGLALRVYQGLGEVLNWMGRHSEAIDAYENMRAAAETLGNDEAQASAWHGIAEAHMQKGEPNEAMESALQEERIARRNQLLLAESKALWMKAWGLFRLGKMDEAMTIAEQVASMNTRIMDQGQAAHSLNLLGVVYSTTGRYAEAAEQFERALGIFRELDNRRRAMPLLNNLGVLAEGRGDYPAAESRYREALEIAREIGNRNGEIVYLSNLGGVKTKLGHYLAAEADLRQVIELVGTAGSYVLPLTYAYLAEGRLAQDDPEEALEFASLAFELAVRDEAREDLALACRALALIAAQGGKAVTLPETEGFDTRTMDARGGFERSADIFKSIGRTEEEARTRWAWAQYELEAGDRESGADLFQQARALFEGLGAAEMVKRMMGGQRPE